MALRFFLAEEFVNGQVEVFAHCVVQGAEQARGNGGAMVVDEVEGAEANELGDGVAGRLGVGSHPHVAVADDAGVGVDFVHDAAVDAVEIDAALGVAAGQLGEDGDDFDIGDFHLGRLLDGRGRRWAAKVRAWERRRKLMAGSVTGTSASLASKLASRLIGGKSTQVSACE